MRGLYQTCLAVTIFTIEKSENLKCLSVLNLLPVKVDVVDFELNTFKKGIFRHNYAVLWVFEHVYVKFPGIIFGPDLQMYWFAVP